MTDVAVQQFVDAARRFCTFIETASKTDDRLRAVAVLLAELYAAALQLPDLASADDYEPADVKREQPEWQSPEGLDVYWEVFDPYKFDEPVAASLRDDLLDVYRDVQGGLDLYDAGQVAEAVWTWRFYREAHWGDHAVDALRALQRAIRRLKA